MLGLTITRNEWRWVLPASLLVLLFASLPVLLGEATSTFEHQFTGVVVGQDDGYVYLGKIRQGAYGEWLSHNLYAVEAHPSIPLYWPYLLLGKLTGPAPDAILTGFHVMRVSTGLLYLLLVYPLVALLLEEVWQRRLAWLLIAAGGGLGLVLVLTTGEPLPYGNAPLSLYLNEAYSFVALMGTPHIPLARSMLIVGLLFYLRALEHNNWMWITWAGLAWLFGAIALPFEMLTAGVAVGGMLLTGWLHTRELSLRTVLMGIVAGLPGSLYVMVVLAAMGTDPVYAAWNAQNLLELPHPAHLLMTFGLPVLLALPGIYLAWREQRRYAGLFTGWAILAPLAMLLPLGIQLRLIDSFSLPLLTLAVMGLTLLTGNRPQVQMLASGGLVAVMLIPAAFLVVGSSMQALAGSELFFIGDDEAVAYAWLDQNAPDDAVLFASEPTGLFAPTRARVRSVLGHGFETPHYDRKTAEVAAFYATTLPAGYNRVDLLEKYAVDYVWWGPNERELGDFEPGRLRQLEVAFERGEVTIYAVNRDSP